MSRNQRSPRALLGGAVLTGLLLAGIAIVLLSEVGPLDLGRLAAESPIRSGSSGSPAPDEGDRGNPAPPTVR